MNLPACLLGLALAAVGLHAAELPAEWVDPDTGHRVRRLSEVPGTSSLYFHQNAFLKDGHRMIVQTAAGVASLDIETRELKVLIPASYTKASGSSGLEIGRTTGRLYFERDHALFSVSSEGGTPQEVCKLPADGHMSAINADETLVVGATTEPGHAPVNTSPGKDVVMHGADGHVLTYAEMRGVRIAERFEMHLPMTLFVVDLRTGVPRTILRCTDWLGHIQFSPTDPGLIMFCHEGPWNRVDRIWTIRSDGSGLTKMHTRHMVQEIWGHEFFGQDGRTIWYDLQTPRGQDFWVAGVELATGHRTWYHLGRNEWSVHFNASADGKLFAGDGGDADMVAHAPDGKWIYLFTPQLVTDSKPAELPGADEWVQAGFFKSERLVNMRQHDYRLEPNVRFSPDGRWVVFRSNMEGVVHTYAVEVAKAKR